MENSELPAGVVEPIERGPRNEEVAVVDVAKRADAKRLVATVVEPFAESKISPGIESMVVPLERYPANLLAVPEFTVPEPPPPPPLTQTPFTAKHPEARLMPFEKVEVELCERLINPPEF